MVDGSTVRSWTPIGTVNGEGVTGVGLKMVQDRENVLSTV